MTASNVDLRLSLLESRVGEIEASLRQQGLLLLPLAAEATPGSTVEMPSQRVREVLAEVTGASSTLPGQDDQASQLPKGDIPLPPDQPVAISALRAGSPIPPKPFAPPPPLPLGLGRKAELLHYPRVQKRTDIPQGDFEKTIGLKWAGWIGALVFVIGTVLGVKYAYDQGWLTDLIPNWVWLSLIASTGFAMIGAGEYVFRKVHRHSAAGLFAAGVGTLFVASYVGHAYYELYSQSIAFTCMGISALIGAAVAIRGDMVSIGVISLLGANVAPILLGDPNAPIASFLAYLLATQIVALVLAARGQGGKWWTLRGLSLGMISFWMLSVIPQHARENVTLVFTLLFAAIYQLELIITNFRHDQQPRARAGEAAGLAFSMLVTAGLTLAILWLHQHDSNIVQTTWVLGIAGVCGALGLILPSQRRPALTDLATGYALQAIALIFVAVPVYTTGINVEIGWAILALGLALIGVLGNKDLSRGASMVGWALALVHLMIRNGNESHPAVLGTLGGVDLHTNAMVAFGLAILGQLIAVLASIRQKNVSMGNAIGAVSVIATLVWCVTSVIEFPASTATLFVLAFAWGLIAIARFLPEKIGSTLATVLLLVSTVKWLLVDALGSTLGSTSTQVPVLLNTMTFAACGLMASAAAFVVMAQKIVNTEKAVHDLRLAMKLAIAVIGLIDLSIEISRWFDTSGASIGLNDPRLAKQVALSIFWACYAVASVGVGFAFREAAMRYFGLILLAGTLMKIVIVDLSGVSQGYRILSFIGVGLLMLGTSVLYGKVSPKLLAMSEENGL